MKTDCPQCESGAGFFAKASENVEKDRISFLLVPSSGLVMADKLPAHARLFDQAKYIDQIENR